MMKQIRTPNRGQSVGGEVEREITIQVSENNTLTSPFAINSHIDLVYLTADVIPFPAPTTTADGWIRSCCECGQRFVLAWVCGTIRDGREKLCPDCLIAELIGRTH